MKSAAATAADLDGSPQGSPAPLLSVQGAQMHFVARRSLTGRATAHVRAVDGVSFDVAAGETLALVGESGCGKSTVGRLALRLIEPTGGRILFEGRDLMRLDAAGLRAFRARAQLVFQDPYASLNPRMTIGDTLAEPLSLHTDLSREHRSRRVDWLLDTVGLKPAYSQRYPHEFSGGQRQRIAIARALAPGPRLIVADEPVSALDVSIRAQVLNLLQELQERLGLTYVFISHDLAVVKHIATRVAVMYLGRIVELASTEELFAAPRHPYTRALLSAIPVPVPKAVRERRLLQGDPPSPIAPPSGCALNPRCAHATDICTVTRPELDADAGGHATACHHWHEIDRGTASAPHDAIPSPSLRRLLAAFSTAAAETDPTG